MSEVEGTGNQPILPSSQDKRAYEMEYKHGLDLFQRALGEYNKAEEIHKKDAFREVMDRALKVMNETAQGLMRDDLKTQNEKIASDYQAFKDKGEHSAESALEQDLNEAKNKI